MIPTYFERVDSHAAERGLALTLLQGRARALLAAALLLLAMVPITAIWIPRFLLFDALRGHCAHLVACRAAAGEADLGGDRAARVGEFLVVQLDAHARRVAGAMLSIIRTGD